MDTKHTKGEWITNEGQIYPAETGKTLALIPYFDKENEEDNANAKLIAAAPELLDALKIAFCFMITEPQYKGRVVLETIKNAIEKAI